MPTNALLEEKSPYLRQHAHNPVNWLPWGEAAFSKARAEDKPIFLSIGYSTCHWCHVMAHESFEDERVAAVLNRDFVPVKLDREERPDVDRIYMLFVQASTGSGGWPMSVFLTPDLRPFFGGTYFPPDSRYGRPGFLDLLGHLTKAWKEDRTRIEQSSLDVVAQLRSYAGASSVRAEPEQALLESAFLQFRRAFDSRQGGFGSAPKFPRPSVFNFLLRYYFLTQNEEALEMTVATLLAMARGGMHDQLGGGFHRYSVDERWFVPHFEKMLYDQAQLATSYLEAFQITTNPVLAESARKILDYVLRDMTDVGGAFFSAEDADSPDLKDPSHSREGAFYVWSYVELAAQLSAGALQAFAWRYGARPQGNVDEDPHAELTDQNILYQALPVQEVAARLQLPVTAVDDLLEEAKRHLFKIRSGRPRPHLDNKILTAWNGLMISAFVKGYQILHAPEYLTAAKSALYFLERTMVHEESGVLQRRYCDGEAAVPAFLDDYAFFIQALLDLFEATGTARYLTNAVYLAQGPLAEFEDEEHGGFFSTRGDSADLILRVKDEYDGAEPSGNSVATDVLLRLAHLTGDDTFRSRADKSLRGFAARLAAQPTMAPQMLVAVARSLAEPQQVVIRARDLDDQTKSLLEKYRAPFHPFSVNLALTDLAAYELAEAAPFLTSLPNEGRITVYECRNFTCALPKVIV